MLMSTSSDVHAADVRAAFLPCCVVTVHLILQVCNRVCTPRQCFSSAHVQSIASFENYLSDTR